MFYLKNKLIQTVYRQLLLQEMSQSLIVRRNERIRTAELLKTFGGTSSGSMQCQDTKVSIGFQRSMQCVLIALMLEGLG